jgi:hypothetical protein
MSLVPGDMEACGVHSLRISWIFRCVFKVGSNGGRVVGSGRRVSGTNRCG